MKRKYLITILSVLVISCIGAAAFYKYELNGTKNTKSMADASSKNIATSNNTPTQSNTAANTSSSSGNIVTSNTTSNASNSSVNTVTSNKNTTSKVQPSNNNSEQNISEKVKDYILNDQQNVSQAQQIKWSKTFLDQVDIKSLYKKYTANGGNANDIQSFAQYITANAPIQNNWQDMFKKDAYNIYKQKIVKLEYLGNDLYQAYIEQNGSQVPFVVVSSRTGYFHG
ncbi:MAG: hypothetical protein PHX70_09945 [Clostridium sp.]|nr:hypothetical protein [Clostridium sp.]